MAERMERLTELIEDIRKSRKLGITGVFTPVGMDSVWDICWMDGVEPERTTIAQLESWPLSERYDQFFTSGFQ